MIKKMCAVLVLTLLISCNKEYKETSKSDFIKTTLHSVSVRGVEIINNKTVLIYTNEEVPYKIAFGSRIDIEGFLEKLKSRNDNLAITNTLHPEGYGLFIWQSLSFILPVLLITHIILLTISLIKIIKSEIDRLDKILYAIISIFFPFFGPLIYLTKSRYSKT